MKGKYLKKVLSLVMASAFVVTSIPGIALESKAAVTKIELPTPMYQFDFEDSLEEASGKTVAVAKIDNLNANYNGQVNYVDGRTNGKRAVRFNNDYGLDLTIPDGGKPTGSYTVSIWAKVESGQNQWGFSSLLFAGRMDTADNAQSWVSVCTGGLWTRAQQSLVSTSNISNDWTQYVLSVDENSGVASLYRNGQYVAERTVAIGTLSENGNVLVLGLNRWDGYIVGSIDDVQIYDFALDAAQVDALYKGAGVSLSAEYSNVRIGEQVEIDAELANSQENDLLTWNSSNDAIATVDENGIVTGISEGTATITAALMRGGIEIVKDEFVISVWNKRGQLVVDFTFDNVDTGLQGAGAVATPSNTENVKFGTGDGRNYLDMSAGNLNLVVTKEGTEQSPLVGCAELTVSYDVKPLGDGENVWLFYASNSNDPLNNGLVGIKDWKNGWVDIYRTENKWCNGFIGSVDQWQHVDVVYAKDGVYIYANRSLVANYPDYNADLASFLTENSKLWIGSADWDTSQYFKGQIDNYKIYNFALTDKEIKNPLDTYKKLAIAELESYKNADDYRADEQERLKISIAGGTQAINNATTEEAVRMALAEAKGVIDKIPTDLMLTKEDFNTVKSEAENIISDYRSDILDSGYLSAQMDEYIAIQDNAYEELDKITISEALTIEEIKAAIASVNALVENTKASIDALPTAADLTVTGISITQGEKLTVSIDDTAVLEAVVKGGDKADRTVSWTSDNPDVATVAADGTVSAITAGTATITAKVSVNADLPDEYKEASIVITVEAKKYTVNTKIGETVTEIGKYEALELVQVTAPEAPAEQKFAYWKTDKEKIVCYKPDYSFYVMEDVTLIPVYVENTETVKEEVTILCTARYSKSTKKLAFTAKRSLPEGYKVVSHGVVITDSKGWKGLGSDESKLVLGAKRTKRSVAETTGRLGTYVARLDCTETDTWYGKAYVTYTDKAGKEHTVYSTYVSCDVVVDK